MHEGGRADDSVGHVRQISAEALATAGEGATPNDLRRSAARLEAALVYLDAPAVRELASGNRKLYLRGYAVRQQLATVYARLGLREQALSMLEDVLRFVWQPELGAELVKDEAFAAYRGEPRFQAIVAAAGTPERLFGGTALATGYRAQLSVEERVAGLSLFWAEARQNFVHFDHVPDLNWDQAYLSYLPKVMAAQTTADYYRVLMQLAALLSDGHTAIFPPKELMAGFYAAPPVGTVMLQDKVLIRSVDSPVLRQRIQVGEEVIAIDGLPVKQYAERSIAPFVGATTPQDRTERMFGRQLLQGESTRPLTLRLRSPGGVERDEPLARSGYTDVETASQFQFKLLPGGVAYFALDQFESEAGVKAFEQALPQILGARSLIIDVRRNRGGSGQYGLEVLSYLSGHPVFGALSYQRGGEALLRAYGNNIINWIPLEGNGHSSMIQRARIFTGPVALLIGPQTYSAAEDFVLSFVAMKRGVTVGSASGGSSGMPMIFGLPGGGHASICIKRDYAPDGRVFIGRGVRPDIEVAPSVEDFRAGRDVVLARAVLVLRQATARQAAPDATEP